MPSDLSNQPLAEWAKRNFSQPVSIRLRHGSTSRTLISLLLFLVPLLIVAALGLLKLSGGAKSTSWWGILLFGVVLSIPAAAIIRLGSRTRQGLAKSLDASGVTSVGGRRFRWEDLICVDHVSKVEREAGVTRKIEDNQLELVFSSGKVIIAPLIEDRQQVWSVINSMPAKHDRSK